MLGLGGTDHGSCNAETRPDRLRSADSMALAAGCGPAAAESDVVAGLMSRQLLRGDTRNARAGREVRSAANRTVVVLSRRVGVQDLAGVFPFRGVAGHVLEIRIP